VLTDSDFVKWCDVRGHGPQTRAKIAHIRSSPPARLVQGRRVNVNGRIPLLKMGHTEQYESKTIERAGLI